MKLNEKVRQYCKSEKLLAPGDRLLVGVSGGADSLCLLVILSEIAGEQGLTIAAAHVNHMIRGEEADADEAFVREFCRERGIPCFLMSSDIPAEAAARKLTEEEAGRVVRTELFESLMAERQFTKLALAHHKNDLAETMLYNMARGTGLAGLASLRPQRGTVIRPLLCADRREIEEFLKERGIAFRTDGTNNEDDHTRNRIRHHVLPYLTEAVNIQAIEHMAALSVTAGETVDFVKNEAARRLFPYLTETEEASGEGFRIGRAFFDEDPVIIRAGLMQVLEALNGPRRDVGRCHLEAVIDLGRGPCGRHLDLPGFMADRTREGLILKKVSKEEVRRHLGR